MTSLDQIMRQYAIDERCLKDDDKKAIAQCVRNVMLFGTAVLMLTPDGSLEAPSPLEIEFRIIEPKKDCETCPSKKECGHEE